MCPRRCIVPHKDGGQGNISMGWPKIWFSCNILWKHIMEKPEPTFWPTQYHSLLPTMGCSALTDIITIYLCIKISQNWGETIGGKCP